MIDGKKFAAGLRAGIAEQVASFKSRTGKVPGLAVILVGEDPTSRVYVANKQRQTAAAGRASLEYRLPEQRSLPQQAMLPHDH